MTMTDETAPAEATAAAAPTEIVDASSRAVAVRPEQPVDHTGGALDRAATAALEAGMPGRDEFLTLAATARILAMSGAAPKLVKGNPYIAFHLALVGRDLGISPSAALALIDVIDTGQGPQLSLSPQLLNGQIRRIGAGEILKKISTAYECVAVAVGPGGIDQRCRLTWRQDVHVEACGCDILGEVEFTWEDAQMAGLAGTECQPGTHVKRNLTRANGSGYTACGCNSGYEKYPKRMMWWRASGFCADDYFPEASLGMYSPEALGAITDADGRAIDPATVEVPDGYEPAALPPPETSDPDEVWNLQLRIRALPDTARTVLKERWANAPKLTLPDGRTTATWALNPAQLRLASSLVNGVESQARTESKGDWQAPAALERTRVAVYAHLCALLGLVASADAPKPEPPTDSPETPLQAQDDAPSGAADPTPTPETAENGDEAEQAPTGLAPGHTGYADEPTLESLGDVSAQEVDEVIAIIDKLDARGVDKELTRLRMHSEGDIRDRRRRLSFGLLRERQQAAAAATAEGEPEQTTLET